MLFLAQESDHVERVDGGFISAHSGLTLTYRLRMALDYWSQLSNSGVGGRVL